MLEGAHIGLNLVFLVPDETGGMESYARELVPAMVEERPDLKFTAFVNREAAESNFDFAGGAIQSVTVPVRSRRRWDWVRGEQQLRPALRPDAGLTSCTASATPHRRGAISGVLSQFTI